MISQTDPTLDENEEEIDRVRAARYRISERFGHDPYRLVAYYMELQNERQDRLVRAVDPGARVDSADES
jgi:hypothetical protein